MTYNDGTWTDEKPEVGKCYWLTDDEDGVVYTREIVTLDLEFWDQWVRDEGLLRSVLPTVPPPPLPSKETR